MAKNRDQRPELVWCNASGKYEQARYFTYMAQEDLYWCDACDCRCQDKTHLSSKKHRNSTWWWCMGCDGFCSHWESADLQSRTPNPEYRWEYSPKGKGGAQAAQGGKGKDDGGKGKGKDDGGKGKVDTGGHFAAAAQRAQPRDLPAAQQDVQAAPAPGQPAPGQPAPDQPAPDQPAPDQAAASESSASSSSEVNMPATLFRNVWDLRKTVEQMHDEARRNDKSLTGKVEDIQSSIAKLAFTVSQVENNMWDLNTSFNHMKEMMRPKFDDSMGVIQGALRRSASGSIVVASRSGPSSPPPGIFDPLLTEAERLKAQVDAGEPRASP